MESTSKARGSGQSEQTCEYNTQDENEASTANLVDTDVDTEESQCTSSSDPEEYIPPARVLKPKKLEKIMLELPTKDLMKDMASISARLKLSQRAATSLYAKIIISGGGELKDFVISKSSTWRQRIAAEKETENKLKLRQNEESTKNPYKILHWDGKKLNSNLVM